MMTTPQQEIPLAGPDITNLEIEAVTEVLGSGQLSIGPQLEAFEQALASRVGRKYGIGVNSGTSGLHLCIRSLGIGEGDEVITTPFSFIATTNCILFERAKPVFVDIDPDSYNMDSQAAEQAINNRTKALLPVEVFGNPDGFGQYERIANRHDLLMIEDCCEALGATEGNRPAGNFGDCGVFAFYPNKQITTAEGGMVVTDNVEVRDLCVSMRNQGRATDAWLSHARLGYNYRMSELSAAIGQVQIGRLDQILQKRRQIANLYDEALADIEEIHLPPMLNRQDASWFVYVVRLADRFSQHQRDSIIAHLRSHGIGCRNYFAPIHLQPYVMELLGTKQGDFPVTERIAARTIALPFFAGLTEGQVNRVRDVLLEGIEGL